MKWSVFRSRYKDWTGPLTAKDIGYSVAEGFIQPTDQTKDQDGNLGPCVELLPGVMDYAARLMRVRQTTRNPKYQEQYSPRKGPLTIRPTAVVLGSAEWRATPSLPTNDAGALKDHDARSEQASQPDQLASTVSAPQVDTPVLSLLQIAALQSQTAGESLAEPPSDVIEAEDSPPGNATVVSYEIIKRVGQLRLDSGEVLSFKRENLAARSKLPDYPVGARVQAQTVLNKDSNPVVESVNIMKAVSSQPATAWNTPADTTGEYKKELAAHMAADRHPAALLAWWSNIRVEPRGTDYNSDHLKQLAKKAQTEQWTFKHDPDKYSILRKYLKFTFYRIAVQQKIAFSEQFATFNTGLVDKFDEPLYALFQRNNVRQRWHFQDFSAAGADHAGSILLNIFGPEHLPPRARYYENPSKLFLNTDLRIVLRWTHIVDDALRRGRYPLEFMLENLPKNMREEVPPNVKTVEWCQRYVLALENDRDTHSEVKKKIDNAITAAIRRAQSNHRTPIPNYFAKRDKLSFLLPMALRQGEKPSLALVVEDVEQRAYYASTVYPLSWAYTSARVVSRPESDWLESKHIAAGAFDDDDD